VARRRRAGPLVLLNRRMRRVPVAADIAFRHYPDIADAARTQRRLRILAEGRRARRLQRGARAAAKKQERETRQSGPTG
jgi:hypothetical protein